MKRIIDIPDEMYDDIKHGYICSEYADTLIQLIPNSTPYEERPRGEWIDTGSGQECSVCYEIQYGYDNFRHFCSNCGADMRGWVTAK